MKATPETNIELKEQLPFKVDVFKRGSEAVASQNALSSRLHARSKAEKESELQAKQMIVSYYNSSMNGQQQSTEHNEHI